VGGKLLEASLEHDILECIFVVLLAGLVEVIHVELDDERGTWRTKEV
jgi:hypothetical protein